MALRRGATQLLQRLRRQGQQESSLASSLAQETLAFVQEQTCGNQVRNAASQLAVKQRMKSIQNMQKITKAMKMVAASKMRVAQVETMKSRGSIEPFLKLLGDHPGADVERNVTVPITSDKGLCGGINSSVAKYARGVLKVNAEDGADKENKLVVIGEKGRAQLGRDQKETILETIADLGKARFTFSQVSLVAEDLLKTEYDAVRVIYNRFVSAVAFKPTIATILSPDALERSVEAGGSLDSYEVEGPDRAELLQDLAEFQLATVLYNAVLENNCSEQAARMTAMENSTKNASEILEKLTLSYNRSRQASITTELIEIISGAAALEG